MSMTRLAARGAVIGVLTLSCLTGFVQTAEAVGGSCSSTRQKDEVFGPDHYRVRASCSSLQGDSKAQGVLDVNADNDYETSWFTTINKYYYSGWRSCVWPSTCDNTYVKLAHV
jgi:hypothetical protein